MNIDSIKNGYVIDHIPQGYGMELYRMLHLDLVDCPVAMIMGALSRQMGKKDIIKVDGAIDISMDVIGYLTPGATVNVIKNGRLIEKRTMSLPEQLTDVLFCKNPRCITSIERSLPHVFTLSDREKHLYRCRYCEALFCR